MLTLKSPIASVTTFATSPVHVKVVASKERPFAQFRRVLMRALAAVQA
jgi:hypothetical protein